MPAHPVVLPAVGQPILTLQSVSKSYGPVHAARDISLQVPRGRIYGLLGPNGAGKTTTIRCIMNIIIPDTGEVRFAGSLLNKSLRDRIGYLPEERGLYRKMTCLEQLAYLAQLKSMPRREAVAQALQWLERLDLAPWRNHKVDTLSKGMQQKIQFAATFIFEPDLVILDEPFVGLDPLNIELLREIILTESKRGTTILFSTHMLAEAEQICDAICLIEGGEKILDGTLDDIRRDFPLHSIQLAYADGRQPPPEIAGISQQEFEAGVWRLTLHEESDPQQLLNELAQAGPVSLFSANRPSLSEIFLSAVRQRRGEVAAKAAKTSAPALEGKE
jgi:ABC-2 type transport system ATP-binding protein